MREQVYACLNYTSVPFNFSNSIFFFIFYPCYFHHVKLEVQGLMFVLILCTFKSETRMLEKAGRGRKAEVGSRKVEIGKWKPEIGNSCIPH